MRAIAVLVPYLLVATVALGMMIEAAHGAGVILWIIIFGYGAGWLATVTGISDWMLE